MNNMSSSCRRCGGVNARRYLQNGGCQMPGRCGYPRAQEGCPVCDQELSCHEHNEGCQGEFDYALAMVYSKLQEFRYIYECDAALGRGTVFAELDKPFEGMTVTGCRR